MTHGTRSGYNGGCRSASCTEANTAVSRARSATATTLSNECSTWSSVGSEASQGVGHSVSVDRPR
jgi:hypothetical protein